MNVEQRNEFLWSILGRIDQYIGTTNSKAALLLAFNTFILGGFTLKADEYLKAFEASYGWSSAAIILLALLGVTCLVSLWITFSVVQPYLNPSKGFSDYHSNIYFGDIARAQDGRSYAKSLQDAKAETLSEDLARQTHVLADSAQCKFYRLRRATRIAVFIQCPILVLLLAIHLIVAAGGGS